jgi:O-antigen/teichoic acid export membrane protein
VRVRDLRHGGLARQSVTTYAFSAAILVLNLFAGVLVARVLGTGGRGELAAITNAGAWIAVLFSMGTFQAMTYHQSRHPADAGRLISTWLVLLLPSAALAIVAGELLIPAVFAAQSGEAIDLARIYIPLAIPMLMIWDRANAVLLGDQDFAFWNMMRLAHPALLALAYVVLWQVDTFFVSAAAVSYLVVTALVAGVALLRPLRRHRLARPSLGLGRKTLWYGVRGQAADALTVMNIRLDLFIMPAFLGASSVGLYSIATNVSYIIVWLSGPISVLVLPIAARAGAGAGEQGSGSVIRSVHLVLGVGLVLALVLGLLADVALSAVYGSDFGGSALPLRLLLPGSVLFAAAHVLEAGLYAANRPFTAVVPQLLGLVVTVAGLLVFLEAGGIKAAAIVSSVSYSLVFLVALILYRRVTELPWTAFLPRGLLRRGHPRSREPAEEVRG